MDLKRIKELIKIIEGISQEEIKKNVNNSLIDEQLLAELDIINWFKIDLVDFNLLKEGSKSKEVDNEVQKKILLVLNKISTTLDYINVINDKVIKSGKAISKNTMSYLLKEKQQNLDNGVIINVYVDGEGENIKLNDLIPKGIIKEKTKKINGEENEE